MPCSCDGYEPTYDYAKRERDLHEMCCQVQSLAHKLGTILEMNKIKIPAEIRNRLEQHRGILQKHKEEELDKDIKDVENNVLKIEGRIKQIRGLGGTPNSSIVEEFDIAMRILSELKRERARGRELLGGV